jgi:nitrile hydratase subunit beta
MAKPGKPSKIGATQAPAPKPEQVIPPAAAPRPAARGAHDLGGLPAGQVDMHEHMPTLTERRIDAMMGLLRDNKRQLWKTDENRRTIESMTPQMYEGSGYYERWVRSMRGLLIEKGVLTEAEIEARLRDVRVRFAGPAATAMPAKPAKKVKASKPGVRPSRGAKS